MCDWDKPASSPLEDITGAKELFRKIVGFNPNMHGYVEQKLWFEIAPHEDDCLELWLVRYVLRISDMRRSVTGHTGRHQDTRIEQLIDLLYSAQWDVVGHKELDSYNSARADLIAAKVDPPAGDPGKLYVELEPKKQDPSYWLATYVLGFTPHEIRCLCNITDVEQPARGIVPLLNAAAKILKGVKLKDKDLQAYHRSRYILLRYYLDAVYHENLP